MSRCGESPDPTRLLKRALRVLAKPDSWVADGVCDAGHLRAGRVGGIQWYGLGDASEPPDVIIDGDRILLRGHWAGALVAGIPDWDALERVLGGRWASVSARRVLRSHPDVLPTARFSRSFDPAAFDQISVVGQETSGTRELVLVELVRDNVATLRGGVVTVGTERSYVTIDPQTAELHSGRLFGDIEVQVRYSTGVVPFSMPAERDIVDGDEVAAALAPRRRRPRRVTELRIEAYRLSAEDAAGGPAWTVQAYGLDAALGVGDHAQAEHVVRAALAADAPELYERLEFDSESDAFVARCDEEDDATRLVDQLRGLQR